MNHSPLPWKATLDGIVDANDCCVNFNHAGSDEGHFCNERCAGYQEQEQANCALAVAAVNNAALMRLSLQPGEVLFVKVPIGIMGGKEGRRYIQEEMAALFPNNRVAVVPKDVDFAAIGEVPDAVA